MGDPSAILLSRERPDRYVNYAENDVSLSLNADQAALQPVEGTH